MASLIARLLDRRTLLLLAVLAAFLAVDLLTPVCMGPGPSLVAMAMIGVCIAQLNLIAVWAALAPGNVFFRLPWSLLLTVLMWYSLVIGNRLVGKNLSPNDAWTLGTILLGGVAVAQVPLWRASRVHRLRLASAERIALLAGDRPLQFRIAHLLLGTVFLSVALSLGQMVLPSGQVTHLDLLDPEPVIVLTSVAVCNLVVTVPCIWAANFDVSDLTGVAVGRLIHCAIVTGLEYVALAVLAGNPGPEAWFMLLFAFNVVQCVTVILTLRILRLAGLRLVRIPSMDSLDRLTEVPEAALVNEDAS
jgi:hypothetical protein